ncbi:MAG: redoxin domain-containing protein [Paracoccaceae bacterium]|nr:redoxin domain-containing protein [Paracoccaceae bacterium]
MTRLKPTDTLPEIDVGLAGGGRWRLTENPPDFLLMIDIYRGYHCPRCRKHMEALSAAMPEFTDLGVDVIALSTDPAERAEKARAEWQVANLPIGYGVPVDLARRLGCYISQSIKDDEHSLFAEPGVFFIRPDLTLYGAVINSFPFARPSVADLIEVAKIVKTRNYPPRGAFAV